MTSRTMTSQSRVWSHRARRRHLTTVAMEGHVTMTSQSRDQMTSQREKNVGGVCGTINLIAMHAKSVKYFLLE